jgi:uncharacterized protein YndB with AHSA1/START domain
MAVSKERVINADADVVFELITDPARLNTWNRILRRTVESPPAVVPGAQWVVEFHALGQTWLSRSTVTAIDRTARRFSYRSATDDGNPSYADWTWLVTPAPSGCVVEIAADLHPATFWRRVLLAKIRARQLRQRELPDSLNQLASAVMAPGAR